MIIGICLFSCNSSKKSVDKVNEVSPSAVVDTIRIENKELDYQIIIMDIGFESWLATQRSSNFYIQPTLESKNKFYVMEWNRRVMNPQVYNSNLYMQPIDYDHQIDYGMEVNYLLYMYFQFFQDKYNQRLY
ncbi:DUF6146 family protein [Lutimonas halocynthiae]|uniref:DUF6146 family protein n=1 Tax=Lutimonas halocynthiae TaxID=1446477 RepID=UPI0025B3670E|nr:DUF6146 family protein [Lutimonas halocynthiae]MDN3643647.1 DUF6146 family protein [Lutimonas halocynthiae]